MVNDNYTPEGELDETKDTKEEETTEEESDKDETKEEETSDQSDESKEDEKDWKAEAAKWKAIAERHKEKKSETKTTSKKSEDFDFAEKAFLTASGIKGVEEHEFTKGLQKQTGLDLDSLLEDNYFKTKLAEHRELKTTSNATPIGSKRSSNSSVDTVDYWIAKGELPPKGEVELRRKVVNARLKKDEAKGVFYNS